MRNKITKILANKDKAKPVLNQEIVNNKEKEITNKVFIN